MSGDLRLYLIRHGEAGNAARDDLRELTPRGREQVRENSRLASERMPDAVETLVASPYARALQTAAIVHQVWRGRGGGASPFLVNDCLVPSGSVLNVVRFVDGLPPTAWPLVLVGHQPLMGTMLAWLTDRPELAGTVATSTISALTLIAFAEGGGKLDWQIS